MHERSEREGGGATRRGCPFCVCASAYTPARGLQCRVPATRNRGVGLPRLAHSPSSLDGGGERWPRRACPLRSTTRPAPPRRKKETSHPPHLWFPLVAPARIRRTRPTWAAYLGPRPRPWPGPRTRSASPRSRLNPERANSFSRPLCVFPRRTFLWYARPDAAAAPSARPLQEGVEDDRRAAAAAARRASILYVREEAWRVSGSRMCTGREESERAGSEQGLAHSFLSRDKKRQTMLPRPLSRVPLTTEDRDDVRA